MDTPTPDTYFMTAIGIGIDQGDMRTVAKWANHFLFYRDRGFLIESRHLLYGMKPYKSRLDTFSYAIVMHCEGLWEDLWGTQTRAEEKLSRSISAIFKSENLSLLSAVFNDLGVLYYRHGDWVRARQAYEEALRFIEFSSSRPRYEAMLHNNLGLALYQNGASEEGIRYLEKAVQIYENSADDVNAARVWVNFGHFLERQGATDRALEVLQRALEVLQQAGDSRILVELLNSLGVLYRYRGIWQQAEGYFRDSFFVARQIEDIGGQAQALSNLGVVAQGQGRYPDALRHYHSALDLYTEVGDKQGIAIVQGNLGHLASLQGNHHQALEEYYKSLDGYQATGDREGEIKARLNIAVAYRDLNAFEDAESWYMDVYTRTSHHPLLRTRDRVLAALGFFRTLQARWAEAESFLQEALVLQQERQDHFAQVETIFKLGVLAYNRHEYKRVSIVTEPGWILAQNYNYGQWLIRFAFLCSDAAKSQSSPAMFRYDTVAWYYAQLYDSPEDAAKAEERIFYYLNRWLDEEQTEAVKELGEWLCQIWEESPWSDTVEPLRRRLVALLLP
jgi:tetratricopeptide (TPR) repeat protein